MSDGARQQRPGSGILFKNREKVDGGQEAWPDYKGSITTPDGTEFWLSAWIKDGKRGKFMSLSMKPKDRLSESAPSKSKIDDEDVPRRGEDGRLPF